LKPLKSGVSAEPEETGFVREWSTDLVSPERLCDSIHKSNAAVQLGEEAKDDVTELEESQESSDVKCELRCIK
jgi:hypothetical protein